MYGDSCFIQTDSGKGLCNMWTASSRCSKLFLKLILVGDYLSCRIQMYLNRNFHSNPTLSHSRFRYFIVDYLCFFSLRK